MKIELIKKGDEFSVRVKWGPLWKYYCSDGWGFWPDTFSWVSEEQAEKIINFLVTERLPIKTIKTINL